MVPYLTKLFFLTNREEALSSSAPVEPDSPSPISIVPRSKSSDILRSKKESPEPKKSHFNSLKQWGKNRLKMMRSSDSKIAPSSTDVDDINLYETITLKRKRSVEREKRMTHERKASGSSTEKSSVNMPISSLSNAMNLAVKLRESSVQRRLRRSGGNKDEPHSSSGNWSASSESGRASIASEITAHPKSTTSTATSSNSLNQHAPSSVNSRRRFNFSASASGSCTSEGTLTPDIIHDLHEDGDSVYSCDTEGYYTSFHMDSGLKTLKEEELPATPLHSTSTFTNITAENEYELFGKGSTSTTTSSAGTVCTTLLAAESSRSLILGPAVPERKSSLSKLSNKEKSPESSLEREYGSSDKTGTVKRSPLTNKATVVAVIHKEEVNGDVSPDSGHNTSSSPIESINSPNGQRSGSEFEFSESSDMEGPDRIERIRVKTTINSSRIPSMCVITPPHSDDESVKSHNFENNLSKKNPHKVNPAEKDLDILKFSGSSSGNQKSTGSTSGRKKSGRNASANSNENQTSTGNQTASGNQKSVEKQKGKSKRQIINVNPKTGYATIETVDGEDPLDETDNKSANTPSDSVKHSDGVKASDLSDNNSNVTQRDNVITSKSVRSASPSGGSVIVKESSPKPTQTQPIFKATLMPLNNMFGKIKMNLSNFAHRRDSKSPNRPGVNKDVIDDGAGEYVTIADVRNNNGKAYTREAVRTTNDPTRQQNNTQNNSKEGINKQDINKQDVGKQDVNNYCTPGEVLNTSDEINKKLNTVLSGKIRETEYVSLNELPTCDTEQANLDSLERRRRQGARVTLNAEGKVVYSSDSLKRRKGSHTTFEPGPFVKKVTSPNQSPLLHRTPKVIRPVIGQDARNAASMENSRPLSPHLGKVVIRASSGMTCSTSEVIRMPPSTIVCPTVRPMSPKAQNTGSLTRGAYVHMQESRASLSPHAGEEGKPENPEPTTLTPTTTKKSICTPSNRATINTNKNCNNRTLSNSKSLASNSRNLNGNTKSFPGSSSSLNGNSKSLTGRNKTFTSNNKSSTSNSNNIKILATNNKSIINNNKTLQSNKKTLDRNGKSSVQILQNSSKCSTTSKTSISNSNTSSFSTMESSLETNGAILESTAKDNEYPITENEYISIESEIVPIYIKSPSKFIEKDIYKSNPIETVDELSKVVEDISMVVQNISKTLPKETHFEFISDDCESLSSITSSFSGGSNNTFVVNGQVNVDNDRYSIESSETLSYEQNTFSQNNQNFYQNNQNFASVNQSIDKMDTNSKSNQSNNHSNQSNNNSNQNKSKSNNIASEIYQNVAKAENISRNAQENPKTTQANPKNTQTISKQSITNKTESKYPKTIRNSNINNLKITQNNSKTKETKTNINPKSNATKINNDSNTNKNGALIITKGANNPTYQSLNRATKSDSNVRTEVLNNANMNTNRKIKRSESYRIANSIYSPTKKIINTEKSKESDAEDDFEKELAAELLREKINYPPTVSPKLCEKKCHIYSRSHAKELLLASPNRVTIPADSGEHKARVLSVSVVDTEIW